jgi:transmembrane sensor
MESKHELNPEDLVNDASFRAWVYQGKAATHWQRWMEEHPDRQQVAEQARQILLSIRGQLDFLPEKEVEHQVDELLEKVSKSENAPQIHVSFSRRWQLIAASLLTAVGLGLFAYLNDRNINSENNLLYEELSEVEEASQIEIINTSAQQQLVNLPDGSSVILTQTSSISFPKEFSIDKREVHLKGEAFFEVKKDPEHPFLVYAGKMQTRVLGTSFTIRAYETDETMSVKVRTGRVSVSALPEEGVKAPFHKQNALILESDQGAVLTKGDGVLSLLEEAQIQFEELIPLEMNLFEFRRTAVTEVLNTIARIYHIDINYDAHLLEHCTITATLGDEPLLDKLTIICEAISASYRIVDGVALIESSGCGGETSR